jgi:arylformamidase
VVVAAITLAVTSRACDRMIMTVSLASFGQVQLLIGGAPFVVAQPGHDLSIAVRFNEDEGRAFWLPPARTEPVQGGGFIGDVRQGGSCNCETHHLCPHSAGTHTEHVGHVLAKRAALADIAFAPLMIAALVRIRPQRLGDVEDEVAGNHQAEDFVVDELSLQVAFEAMNMNTVTALVVATSDHAACMAARHSGTNPAYLTLDAMRLLRDRGIDHLLVDLPSVDREDDGGLLGAHRVFFGVSPHGQVIGDEALPVRTITELVAVPDGAAPGVYALLLQTPSWGADAAPSRPVLYPLLPSP